MEEIEVVLERHEQQIKTLERDIVNSGRTATLARRFSHGVTGF